MNRRYLPREDTAAARLLDRIAPITSLQLDEKNRQEWELRKELTEMLRQVEDEAVGMADEYVCPCGHDTQDHVHYCPEDDCPCDAEYIRKASA